MDYKQAQDQMRSGHRMTRASWNNPTHYLEMGQPDEIFEVNGASRSRWTLVATDENASDWQVASPPGQRPAEGGGHALSAEEQNRLEERNRTRDPQRDPHLQGQGHPAMTREQADQRQRDEQSEMDRISERNRQAQRDQAQPKAPTPPPAAPQMAPKPQTPRPAGRTPKDAT